MLQFPCACVFTQPTDMAAARPPQVEDQQSRASSQHSSASQTFMGFDQLGILLDWLGLLPVLRGTRSARLECARGSMPL